MQMNQIEIEIEIENETEITYRLLGEKSQMDFTAIELFRCCQVYIEKNKKNCRFELDLSILPGYVKEQFTLAKCDSCSISDRLETGIYSIEQIYYLLSIKDNRFYNPIKQRKFKNDEVHALQKFEKLLQIKVE